MPYHEQALSQEETPLQAPHWDQVPIYNTGV